MPTTVVPLRTADLGGGHWMQTTAELNSDSLVVSFTEHMTCTNKTEGFTGGVQLYSTMVPVTLSVPHMYNKRNRSSALV